MDTTSVSSPVTAHRLPLFVTWKRSNLTLPPRPVEPQPPIWRFEPRLYQARGSSTAQIKKSKAAFDRSENRRLQAYSLNFKKRVILYQKRFMKFLNRKAHYLAVLAKISAGAYSYKMGYAKYRPENPYKRVIVESPVISGTREVRDYRTIVNRPLNDSHPRPTAAYAGHESETFLSTKEVGSLNRLFASGYQAFGLSSLDGALASAQSAAMSSCLSKVRSKEVHVGNFLAESHKTLDMLTSAVKRVAMFLLSSKKILFRQLLGSKQTNDDFLAFVFGVRPLLADVHDAAQSLAKHMASETARSTIEVRSAHVANETVSDTQVFWSGGYPAYRLIRDKEISVKVSIVLRYAIANDAATQIQGFGLLNPLEVAWEILPWSFVIDWFLPIGNWLANLSNEAGLQYRSGTMTTTITETTHYSYVGDYPYNAATNQRTFLSASGVGRVETKERVVLNTAPFVPLPQFKSPLSFLHAAEAIALLRQMFFRR
jgi:hypothetical protein